MSFSALIRTGRTSKALWNKNSVKREFMKRRKLIVRLEENLSKTSENVASTTKVKLVKKDTEIDVPYKWQEQLANISKMRINCDAPVDTMGCHMIADVLANPKVFRFQTLLGLMLSSQTKDQITAAAMQRLRAHGCSVENMLAISQKELEQIIIPVSFYKRKALYIKKVAEILRAKYDDDIPGTVTDLCLLPGVGPKMAYLAMQSAWDKMEGIGVDTHVHRIANRIGFVKTKKPEETRVALEDFLPREKWKEINKVLVGFGQQTCLPVYPKCLTCLNHDICPKIGVLPKGKT